MIEQLPRSTAFGKITVVYGHIDENGHAVRKRTVPKMAITDKMVKNSCLSVNLSEILADCPKNKKYVPSQHVFLSLFSCVRGHKRSASHLVLIKFRPATRLVFTPCSNRVSPHIPPIASKDSLDEASSPSVVQSLRTGSWAFGFTPCS